MEKVEGRAGAKVGSWSWCLEKEKQQYKTQVGRVEKLARESEESSSGTAA